jgi:hypothetical protein
MIAWIYPFVFCLIYWGVLLCSLMLSWHVELTKSCYYPKEDKTYYSAIGTFGFAILQLIVVWTEIQLLCKRRSIATNLRDPGRVLTGLLPGLSLDWRAALN